MEVKEINEVTILNSFIGSQARAQFLQSWAWGEFQRSLPNKIFRIGVWKDDKLVGSAQLIEHTLAMGRKYWYCPKGPVVNNQLSVNDYQVVLKELVDNIVSQGDEARAMFVKIEPPVEKSSLQVLEKTLQSYKWEKVKFVQPQDTLFLNLTKSEEELLKVMHQKTRYNIRLAEKKGVNVRFSREIGDFEAFWQLIKTTGKRNDFHYHTQSYYHNMYRQLVPTDFMELFIAELEGRIIAANLIVSFGDTVTYLHGASSDEHREVMAPYLLQWRQIQEAKKRGFRHYDFWGVAPTGTDTRHNWAGITRFKKGFGGSGASYAGVYDLILDTMWYKIYKLAQKIRIN